ncbi:MAG: AMP-binding protein [Macromonas sp.]
MARPHNGGYRSRTLARAPDTPTCQELDLSHRPPPTDRPWLEAYPAGVPADIDTRDCPSLVALLEDSFARYAQRTAFHCLGAHWSYREVDLASQALAAWLQHLGLAPGERVAVMLPNTPQYPVAVAAILRAGLVLVNVNPLYTARELQEQLQDSGAQAVVVLENFAATLESCIAHTAVRHVLLCSLGDMLGCCKGALVNTVVRHVKRLVPPFNLPQAVRWRAALHTGQHLPLHRPTIGPDDLAALQYTGGTTGTSKGAMLLHRNVVANVLQSEAWNAPALRQVPTDETFTTVCALPLYHIFAFTVNLMLTLRVGGQAILIPNARDLDALLRELQRHRFHLLPGVNTLFNALLQHRHFDRVDWRSLKVTLGGGMAVQAVVAQRWLERTGCAICEGYGLSEASPSVSCNPVTTTVFNGSIGLPLPGTRVRIVDDHGQPLPCGQAGEIVVQGPQVMAGYWQQPQETAQALPADGWLRTGDIGVMDAQGYCTLLDRKKDVIIVSGFNVYPNEVEAVVSGMAGVLECGAVGIPDARCGEAVKLMVVKHDPALTVQHVRDYCQSRLTGYKQPRVIEFCPALPKNAVGKILRRALRAPPP